MSKQTKQQANVVALPWVDLKAQGEGQRKLDGVKVPSLNSQDANTTAEVLPELLSTDDQMKAPMLYAELLAKPQAERLQLVANCSRFASYLLAEMLLEKSRESWFDDLAQALEAAELANAVVTKLEEASAESCLLSPLKVRSLAYLGNALRIRNDLQGAVDYFDKVDELLEEVSLEPTEWAGIRSLQVSLYTDVKVYDRASALVSQIVEVYRSLEDTHQVARSLFQKARLFRRMNEPEAAVDVLREALPMIDVWRDPRMYSYALQNLASSLQASSRPEEALEALGEARRLLIQQGERLALTRTRWVEAKILVDLDRQREAEEAFAEVSKAFAERGLAYDQALVCLDLALLYAGEQRMDRVRELASEMLPIFRSYSLGQEVMAALVLFQHAAEREIATLGLIREIVGYLRRAEQFALAGEDYS